MHATLWHYAPKGFDWFAMDRDGCSYFYKKKPNRFKSGFGSDQREDNFQEYDGPGEVLDQTIMWQQSRVARPGSSEHLRQCIVEALVEICRQYGSYDGEICCFDWKTWTIKIVKKFGETACDIFNVENRTKQDMCPIATFTRNALSDLVISLFPDSNLLHIRYYNFLMNNIGIGYDDLARGIRKIFSWMGEWNDEK